MYIFINFANKILFRLKREEPLDRKNVRIVERSKLFNYMLCYGKIYIL